LYLKYLGRESQRRDGKSLLRFTRGDNATVGGNQEVHLAVFMELEKVNFVGSIQKFTGIAVALCDV
jgi:hypothetical protein